jgi:NAD(P)-dependent dehydrogenase (short-subunit alcohol dehydrogenase family)
LPLARTLRELIDKIRAPELLPDRRGFRAKLRQENLDVQSVKLDVTDLSSIVAAKELVEKEDGKLDVLVNNAGWGFLILT